jgi:hypothetical protein
VKSADLLGGGVVDSARAQNRISRRRMLKRIGAGAAVAWSAPIISSLRTPAFAQYPPRCAPTDVLCGNTDPPCGGTSGCPECPEFIGACAGLDDGSCFCWFVGGCRIAPGDPICQTDSDCGPGGKCAPTVCDECAGNRICLAPCGGGGRTLPRRKGMLVVTAR